MESTTNIILSVPVCPNEILFKKNSAAKSKNILFIVGCSNGVAATASV
jgi:hypothetical protein